MMMMMYSCYKEAELRPRTQIFHPNIFKDPYKVSSYRHMKFAFIWDDKL